MVLPRESVEQRRGVIPRHVRVVAQTCGVRALNVSDMRAGAGVTCARGALERGGPRPRGRSALERGGPRPRGRSGGLRGPPGSWSCCVCVVGSWISLCFAFFYETRWVFPGCLGDPLWLSPTKVLGMYLVCWQLFLLPTITPEVEYALDLFCRHREVFPWVLDRLQSRSLVIYKAWERSRCFHQDLSTCSDM
jgi:hypothetical protein